MLTRGPCRAPLPRLALLPLLRIGRFPRCCALLQRFVYSNLRVSFNDFARQRILRSLRPRLRLRSSVISTDYAFRTFRRVGCEVVAGEERWESAERDVVVKRKLTAVWQGPALPPAPERSHSPAPADDPLLCHELRGGSSTLIVVDAPFALTDSIPASRLAADAYI